MAKQIQGRNVTVQIFQNGQVVRGLPMKKVDWDADQEIRVRDLLGQPRSQRSLLIHGYKGTFESDIESRVHHDLIRFLNDNDKSPAGSNTYELALQIREVYTDGSSCSYRFVRAVIKIPKTSAGGRRDDAINTWEWEAEDIVYLN